VPRGKRWTALYTQARINGILAASALANLLFNHRPLDPLGVHRILIVQTRDLGDVVVTTVLIAPLRRRFPNAEIIMATGTWAHDLAMHGGADKVLSYHSDLAGNAGGKKAGFAEKIRAIRDIVRAAPEVIIDLRGDLGTVIAAILSGARYRVDRGSWRIRDLLRNCRKKRGLGISHDLHEADIFLEIVRQLGIVAEEKRLRLMAYPDETQKVDALLAQYRGAGRPIVALHPGAATADRMWPAERFAALANLIAQDTDTRIVITGSGKEKRLAERIAATAKIAPLDLCGDLSLGELYALYSRCALWIGNDTGPMHIAAAAGVPLVAICKGSRPRNFGPLAPRCLVVTDRDEGNNHGRAASDDITAISVGHLWSRLQRFADDEQLWQQPTEQSA
jgi:ADP-heptose:LPS heptosyltransferase